MFGFHVGLINQRYFGTATWTYTSISNGICQQNEDVPLLYLGLWPFPAVTTSHKHHRFLVGETFSLQLLTITKGERPMLRGNSDGTYFLTWFIKNYPTILRDWKTLVLGSSFRIVKNPNHTDFKDVSRIENNMIEILAIGASPKQEFSLNPKHIDQNQQKNRINQCIMIPESIPPNFWPLFFDGEVMWFPFKGLKPVNIDKRSQDSMATAATCSPSIARMVRSPRWGPGGYFRRWSPATMCEVGEISFSRNLYDILYRYLI